MKRRTFFKRAFISIVGLSGLFALDAFWFEKYIIDWTDFDLSDGQKEKITLVQLSDIHLREIDTSLESIVRKVNDIAPDALLFTGDTITSSRRLALLDTLLGMFDHQIPKVMIYGNKEHSGKVPYEDLNKLLKAHNGLVLVNANFEFVKGTRRINILGIDDFIGGDANFKKALATVRDKNLETVVLNHCPEYSDTISEINGSEGLAIKCILSGHTHGGQVTFFGKEIYKPAGSGRYLKGWYTAQGVRMYVSKGVGTTILPVRFCARAEASVFYV